MAIKDGDFVRVNFTGKIKETDDVFDTTYDEIAQEAEIFDENKTYKPIPIVVGGNHLLPAIEKEIVGFHYIVLNYLSNIPTKRKSNW